MRRAILLAAFGAATPQGRQALHAFDAMVRERFAGWSVRWAFTSPLLRERLARARQKSDSVRKALMRLSFERYERVAVQPLQAIAGAEHEEVCAACAEAVRKLGLCCRVGAPLLAETADVEAAARALAAHLPEGRLPHEDVVLMGHGARHAGGARYGDLAAAMRQLDARVHVGTMGDAMALTSILPRLTSGRVWLMPLLSVVGQHALRDMAGDGAGSWRSRIEGEQRECVPVLRGLVEYPGVAGIWLRHLETAAAEACGETLG
ncbi:MULTISPECIES: sirohydrochlorin cobaltochelatase [unclassified Desulfovibrio]|uniref:sirohydrochlorin cobaltochelatase n=1 Tax=unclassified Desulfovibrio TaxID=2593640 RepID=UPI0013E9B5C6|nr:MULTISPECIES: sirohydrochlorin cobaltochelatase [unclassified Desulfovibrio]